MKLLFAGLLALVATCSGQVGYSQPPEAAYITQLRGNEQACKHLTASLIDIGQYRDAGVKLDQMLPFVKSTLDEALKDPDAFIKTDADVKFVLDSVKKIWARSDPVVLIAGEILRDCMKKEINI